MAPKKNIQQTDRQPVRRSARIRQKNEAEEANRVQKKSRPNPSTSRRAAATKNREKMAAGKKDDNKSQATKKARVSRKRKRHDENDEDADDGGGGGDEDHQPLSHSRRRQRVDQSSVHAASLSLLNQSPNPMSGSASISNRRRGRPLPRAPVPLPVPHQGLHVGPLHPPPSASLQARPALVARQNQTPLPAPAPPHVLIPLPLRHFDAAEINIPSGFRDLNFMTVQNASNALATLIDDWDAAEGGELFLRTHDALHTVASPHEYSQLTFGEACRRHALFYRRFWNAVVSGTLLCQDAQDQNFLSNFADAEVSQEQDIVNSGLFLANFSGFAGLTEIGSHHSENDGNDDNDEKNGGEADDDEDNDDADDHKADDDNAENHDHDDHDADNHDADSHEEAHDGAKVSNRVQVGQDDGHDDKL